MDTVTLFWIGTGIVFLIIEMMIATFYGLSISIAAFVVAVYAAVVHPTHLDVTQGLLFAAVSLLASFTLPRWLLPNVVEKPQGLDLYIGEKRKVKIVGEDMKVTLDGIDYIILLDDENAMLSNGDRVEITGRHGSVFYAKKL